MIEIRTYMKKHREITKLRNVPSANGLENQGSFGKYWSQQEERMQVQNGTEPDVRRSKRSL